MINSRLFGGWLTVFETLPEHACVENWAVNSQQTMPKSQRYAIGLRADFSHPGQYLWQNEDHTESFPEWDLPWASSHPTDKDCVSMVIGTGVDHQGEFVDHDCYDTDGVYAICEHRP